LSSFDHTIAPPASAAVQPREREITVSTFDDTIWQGALASISWDTAPPHTVAGTVMRQELATQTDFTSGEPLTWPDGRLRRKAVVTLATDDGELVNLHVKIPSALYGALTAAINIAQAPGLRAGDLLTITYTGDAPKEGRKSAQKLFTALLEPGAGKVPDDPFAQGDDD
jgi:hypothetical protein